MDGVCLTDHDEAWSRDRVRELSEKHEFLVLRGFELSSNCGHILVFGLDKCTGDLYRVERVREVVDSVGGVMILSHPFRFSRYVWAGNGPIGLGRRPGQSVEDGASKPVFRFVDALEVINGGTEAAENAFAAAVAEYLGLPGSGGSDAHHLSQVGSAVTEFERTIASEEDFIRELKAGRFRARDLRDRPVPNVAPK